MAQHDPFKTWGDDLWSKLDGLESSDWWQESPDERDEFESRVRDSMRTPTVDEPAALNPLSLPANLKDLGDRSSAPPVPEVSTMPSPSIPVLAVRPSSETPIRARPTAPSLDTPIVDTPPAPRSLPRPQPAPATSSTTPTVSTKPPTFLETPGYVPTPTQSQGDVSVGKGRRDDPATPVPIGVDPCAKKVSYTKITNQFNAFNLKILAAANSAGEPPVRGSGKFRGRGRVPLLRSARSAPRPELFKGVRFCMPPEGPHCGAKHESRWSKIVEYGGTVVIQPDTAVTHVIWDQGASASGLAKKLGLQTLSELPEGTICVKWDWVVKCQMTGQLLDPKPYLTFKPTTLSNQPTGAGARSRLSDITQKVSGASKGGKRKYDSSDTETESSEPLHRYITAHRTWAHAAKALPKKVPNTSASVAQVPPRSGAATDKAPDTSKAPLATDHNVATGAGWARPAEGEADALDALISGVINGDVEMAESDEDSECEAVIVDPEQLKGNPNPRADKFKCGQASDGTAKGGPNEALAKKFDELHAIYKGTPGKNDFSILQYSRGIIRRYPHKIKSGQDIRKERFVGQAMIDRIDEFLTPGAHGRLYFEDTDQARIVARFQDIYGVGRKFAHELYGRGARSIEDLRTKDYGLTAGQKIGVELYEDLCSRIPREECRELFETVRDEALSIDDKIFIEIMGSYRRGEPNSGDIDILITRDPSDGLTHRGLIRKIVAALTAKGFITHALGAPNDWNDLECKWMGVCRLPEGKHRRIDILSIPWEQRGAALLYFTGNAIFNRSLRLYARKSGYSLNQRGLYRNVIRNRQSEKVTEGEIVASQTEEEIFGVLGIRWRPPHLRRP